MSGDWLRLSEVEPLRKKRVKVDSFWYYVLDAPCWVNISLKDIEIFKRQLPAKHYQLAAPQCAGSDFDPQNF